jgi:DNA-binding PadR family transcriptional regulator
MKDDELLQSLIIDLRRGTLVLAVLSCLKEAKYGYSLLQDMEQQGIRIEANTLYPLLRRLETQGLLKSDWDTG